MDKNTLHEKLAHDLSSTATPVEVARVESVITVIDELP